MSSLDYDVKRIGEPTGTVQRQFGIDLLRIICAVAVVLIHICSAPISVSVNVGNTQLRNNLELFHNLLNWSVPCFYMTTGFCLQKKEDCSFAHCFRHVRKYALCLMTVGYLQALSEEIYVCGTINASILLASVIRVLEGRLWDHMWYVYSIIGIYLVMPIIHNFVSSSRTNAKLLTGLLFVFSVFLPAMESWVQFGIDLPLGNYLFYVCVGAVVAAYPLNRLEKSISFFLGGISFVYMIIEPSETICGYTDPAVCFIAIAVFLIVGSVKGVSKPPISIMARCTWGVYLLHPFFINFVIKLLGIDLLCSYPYVRLAGFAVVTIIVSFGFTYLLRKLSWARIVL